MTVSYSDRTDSGSLGVETTDRSRLCVPLESLNVLGLE